MQNAGFGDRPMVVVWEMTRACRLACRHCRAEARRWPDSREICGREIEDLLDQVAAAKPGLLILTGGDPSRRHDLMQAISLAKERGLKVAFSPSATPDLLALDFNALREAGVWRASLSLDAATAEEHNAFRGVSRAWDWTYRAIQKFRNAGIPVQINSTVTAHNIGSYKQMAEVVRQLDPVGWTLFLVVPTGRAAISELPDPGAVEELFEWLCDYSRTVPFVIRTTEGQHYRRVLLQKSPRSPVPPATNGAKGFVFISHTGDICPSGFLPIVAGNIRQDNFLTTYREAPAFVQLRDPSLLKGKCGRCPFNALCGGSRARAYGCSGDLFAEDPLCAFQP